MKKCCVLDLLLTLNTKLIQFRCLKQIDMLLHLAKPKAAAVVTCN